MSTKTSSHWQSPSNIALVKYWGKKGFQLPANASISFTLDQCHTKTKLEWHKKTDQPFVRVLVDEVEEKSFLPKVESFFYHVAEEHPIILDFSFVVKTSNTFPHSSGIASSASGMSALALCLTDFLIDHGVQVNDFFQFASNLARMGSGSACRSVYAKTSVWGQHHDYPGSSDHFGTGWAGAHEIFSTYRDTILIVDEGSKSISSTVGHALLNNHVFAQQRFETANQNMSKIKTALETGNLDAFIDLVESEALMLHAMMMTSDPSFVLMKPETLAIIQAIRQSRESHKHHICFTLDAGANVHMLYPEKDTDYADELIQDQLVVYCQNGRYIRDNIGQGPKRLDA